MGESRSNPLLAGLVGLIIGGASCAIAAPLYGGMVVDGLTHDAMGLAWGERERIVAGARDAVSGGTSGTVEAVREGRGREELARLQEQARSATTAQGRQNAAQGAKSLAAQLTPKGIALVKSSAARLSAFALLLWALVAPPLGAAFECRRARR